MFCPNCGTQNPETTATCTKCNFNLRGATAPKFKGTMLMMNNPGAVPRPPPVSPGGVPLPPPAPGGAAPAPQAMPSKLKGTIVGVAPPIAMPAPPRAVSPPAAGADVPAAASGATQSFGAPQAPPMAPPVAPPPIAPPFVAAPAAAAPPPSPLDALGPSGVDASAVNPLGGTLAADPGQNPFGGFGAPPPPPPAPAYGAGFSGAGDPFGAPPAPPAAGGGGPGFGLPQPAQPAGFGAPSPDPGGFGAAPPAPPYGPPPEIGQAAPNALGGFGSPPQGYGSPPNEWNAPMPGAAQPMVPYGPPPMAPPAPMSPMQGGGFGQHGPKGQVRNGLMMLVYGLLTCGLYQLWWFWQVCDEMKAYLQRDEPSFWKVLLLSSVTCGFYGLYWQLTRLGALVQECQARAGIPNAQNLGFMYLIPYYNVILLQDELNKVWQSPQ